MVERVNPALPISQQCRLLELPRSSVYRKPAEVNAEDLAIMALIDRQNLARPFYGSRRMAAWLATQGHAAAVGSGGDLPAPEHQQAERGPQDLSLPARRANDRAGQIRSGAPMSPTFRWPRALSTWS